MRYAVFSDVHANPAALGKVVSDARRCGAEKFVCLGDTVGYGPLPSEAVAAVRSVADLVLCGNHDAAVAGTLDAADFIDLAGEAVTRHKSALSAEDIAWLKSLPPSAEAAGAAFAHGDLTDPGVFNYVDSEEAAAENFAATNAQIVFVGHTHVPEMFIVGASGAVHRLEPQDFVAEEGKRYIVNVGSVGYPRESNGVCLSSYVLYDTDEKAVRFRFLPFSVASVMQRGAAPARRSLMPPVIAALAALGLLAGAAVYATRKTATDAQAGVATAETAQPPAASVQAPAEKPLAEKMLALDPDCRTVRPNLLVEGAPVSLDIAFLDDFGEKVAGGENHTVKHQWKKKTKIPAGARKAVFTVRETKEERGAKIRKFAPEALK